MATPTEPADGCPVPITALAPFLLITFGLAWGILGLYIGSPERMAGWFGQLTGEHPLFYLCVHAPAWAAVAIILRHSGLAGLRRYLSRLLLWHCSPTWYLFLFVGIPVVFYTGAALAGTLGAEPWPFATFWSLVTAMLLAAVKGPVEELGWRGLALPLLQRRLAPLWSGLVMGVVWGFWHLPAFLLSGTQQSNWSFAPFFAGCVALSVIATSLFNASRGSLLLSALFHYLLMNPVFPDAAPYDTYLFIVIALVVIGLDRDAMLTRSGAVTTVIPGAGQDDEAGGA